MEHCSWRCPVTATRGGRLVTCCSHARGRRGGRWGRALTERDMETSGRAEEDSGLLETHARARGKRAPSHARRRETGVLEPARKPRDPPHLPREVDKLGVFKGRGHREAGRASGWLWSHSTPEGLLVEVPCVEEERGAKGRRGRGSGVRRAVCAQLPRAQHRERRDGDRPLISRSRPSWRSGRGTASDQEIRTLLPVPAPPGRVPSASRCRLQPTSCL